MTNTWCNEIMGVPRSSRGSASERFYPMYYLHRTFPPLSRPNSQHESIFNSKPSNKWGQRNPRLEYSPSSNCLAFQFLWTTLKWMQKEEARNIPFAGRRRALAGGLSPSSTAFDVARARARRKREEKKKTDGEKIGE